MATAWGKCNDAATVVPGEEERLVTMDRAHRTHGRDFWEHLCARIEVSPDGVLAVDERGISLTFAAYKAQAEDVAAGLCSLGIGSGSVVAWQLPTWIETMVLAGALARLGAVQVPLIPSYRARELKTILAETEAAYLVVPTAWKGFDYPAMASVLAAARTSLQVLVVDTQDRVLPTGDPAILPPVVEPSSEAPVRWLYYTSGTTGAPKGARHTDATLLGAVEGMLCMLEPVPGDRSTLVFPFAHVGGLVWLLTSFAAGSTQLLAESFDPKTTIPMLAANGVTLAGIGTPFNLAYLAAQRALEQRAPGTRLFPQLRACMSGASPKPPSLHAELRAEMGGSGILSSYGMTEAPILTYCGPRATDQHRATTEGRACPGVTLRITDEDGRPVPTGHPGEIRVRGPQVCHGYVDCSLNADAFDPEGFLRTGDLGTVDAQGYLTIVGRLKDVIIRNGENISAKEIEDLLFLHPAVSDAAVIGLPDARVGERCCAVVALARPEVPLTFEEMTAFLRDHDLMVQKIPEQLEIVSHVPRNAAGKVLKGELRERYRSTVAQRP